MRLPPFQGGCLYMKIFNLRKQRSIRKNLRNNPPDPEKILWRELSGKKLDGYKFRRQHGIRKYIVDFYCPKAKLVIELDGDSHFDEAGIESDEIRTKDITKNGITIQRFTNLEIRNNLEGVIAAIQQHLT